jgi:hypothetical protein
MSTHRAGRRSLLRRTACGVVGTAALLVTAGCGGGDPKPGPEVAGGVAGVDVRVTEDVDLVDVELAYPLDGVYSTGEDAPLYAAVTNTGPVAVTLEEVSGPDFSDAWEGAGAADLSIEVPPNDTVYIGAEGQPAVTLVDLHRELRSSESIPVTFRFGSAGEVTVPAMVAAEGQTPAPTYDFPDPAQDPTGDT